MNTPKNVHDFYIIKDGNDRYYAGFDTAINESVFVDDPLEAKMFSHRNQCKLRPNEMLVKVFVEFSKANTAITPPFRPKAPVHRLAA